MNVPAEAALDPDAHVYGNANTCCNAHAHAHANAAPYRGLRY